MKIRCILFGLWMGGLCFFNSAQAEINIDAHSRYNENAHIYTYVFNRVLDATIVASSTKQNFYNFSGLWVFNKPSARFFQNIQMNTLVQNIQLNLSFGRNASTFHSIHIDIYKRELKVGSCDLSYGYSGMVDFKQDAMNFPPIKHLHLSDSVYLSAMNCTEGFKIERRNSAFFPNSFAIIAHK